jgi:transcriptional regulator with XRE-family HTH domain
MLSMDLKEAMATNLRRARHARKLTQEELADRAGLSARYLGSIERAAVSASVTALGRLAQALRVDACELIRIPPRR